MIPIRPRSARHDTQTAIARPGSERIRRMVQSPLRNPDVETRPAFAILTGVTIPRNLGAGFDRIRSLLR